MGERTPIDFARLADALLERADALVEEWLPHGEREGKWWYVGDFDGGRGRSANVNLETGGWGDNGSDGDSGRDLISLYARIHGLSNGEAARELMERLGWGPAPAPEPQRRSQASARGPAQAPDGESAGGDGRPEPPPEDPVPPGGLHAASPAGPPTELVRANKVAKWQPVVPVPPYVKPPRDFEFGYRDKKRGGVWVPLTASRVWEYRFEGELYGYVARFERITSDGEVDKITVPRTFCEDLSDGRGTRTWHWKSWDQPRPLYVPATLLSGEHRLPVVVVEGEKCADAGHQLLGHEFDFVSWPGGCKTWSMARWAWLMGRDVILWPDCDAKRARLTREEAAAGVDPATKPVMPEVRQPGMKAMVGVGSLLQAEHGCSVSICKIPAPGKVPDGWDIADAIADGWDADRVRAFLRAAVPFVAPDEAVRAATGNGGAGGGAAGKPPRSGAAAEEGEGAGGGADDEEQGWRRYLLMSEKGAVKAVRENAVLALDGWPERGVQGAVEVRGLIRFNEFTNNVVKTRATPWGTAAGVWEEADELLMGEWLVREQWLPSMSRGTLEEAVLMVAHRNSFHPVREHFLAYRGTWDGTPRLPTWLRRVCLEEDEWDDAEPLHRYLSLAGMWFVMGMVARVLPVEKRGPDVIRGPGTKFDYMLVLEGPQGWGKSTTARILGGDWFADTGLVLGDKDSYQNIQGVLVYEWGEMENLSVADVRKVKSFVSSPKDRFRASFDRRPRDYPRQVVFVGTTNEDHYLTDVTGNRRFWPVRITRPPDQAWLRENLPQLLAEALHRLDAGEPFWPTQAQQRELFDPQQRLRTVESSLEAEIKRYLYDEDQKVSHNGRNGAFVNEITLVELLSAIGYTIDKQTNAVMRQAGSLMGALGWEVKRDSAKDADGKRPRRYVRPRDAGAPVARASTVKAAPTQGDQPQGGDDDCPF